MSIQITKSNPKQSKRDYYEVCRKFITNEFIVFFIDIDQFLAFYDNYDLYILYFICYQFFNLYFLKKLKYSKKSKLAA